MGGEISKLHYYDFHRDKSKFEYVTFIPLRSSFYTIVCAPKGVMDKELEDLKDDVFLSGTLFERMKAGLKEGDLKILNAYLNDMKQYAKTEYSLSNAKDTQIHIFYCSPGSALTFEAWKFVHGTVTVDDNQQRRDLLIIHQFEPTSNI